MPMDTRIKKITQDADRLFSQRQPLHDLWQEIAYNFHVDMADFTVNRYLGDEYADHLTTSYPLIARRTLGDSISAMLRPVNLNSPSPGVWFNMTTEDDELNEEQDVREWLEYATGVQRRAMYDRVSQFVRSTKEADHIFATFGNAVLTVQPNRTRDALLYQNHHLRDVVWMEDAEGQINAIYRRWKPTAQNLVWTFGSKASVQCKEQADKDPYRKTNCMHVIMRTDAYEQRDANGRKFNTPWVSLWVDTENDHVMEETGSRYKQYIIPRWVTLPGSQYASSPCVTAALPDARLIQAMTLTLLESGEKFADPPTIATQEAIRGGVELFAGGMTYVDAEYDERLGEAIRPYYEPRASEGMRVGLELAMGIREAIAKAFFLDSLSLPPIDARDMTAFEVGQRISEWIRRAMPIFEPILWEYNAPLCEETFAILLDHGAFGPLDDMPQQLRGAGITFKFESPLHESHERQKQQRMLEAKSALVQLAEIDPAVVSHFNAVDTFRDVMQAIGTPADWMPDEREAQRRQQAMAEQQAAGQAMGGMEVGADVAQKLGAAAKSFSEAGGARTPGPI